jgi:hypothetical protein
MFPKTRNWWRSAKYAFPPHTSVRGSARILKRYLVGPSADEIRAYQNYLIKEQVELNRQKREANAYANAYYRAEQQREANRAEMNRGYRNQGNANRRRRNAEYIAELNRRYRNEAAANRRRRNANEANRRRRNAEEANRRRRNAEEANRRRRALRTVNGIYNELLRTGLIQPMSNWNSLTNGAKRRKIFMQIHPDRAGKRQNLNVYLHALSNINI